MKRTAILVSSLGNSTESTASKDDEGVCAVCGVSMADAPKNCEGGAVAGGLGSLPYIKNIVPVKVWRQCPAAAQRGVPYRRRGQDNDGSFCS